MLKTKEGNIITEGPLFQGLQSKKTLKLLAICIFEKSPSNRGEESIPKSMKHPTANKEHMISILKNMSLNKDVCTTATECKAFTSWRLLPCNFRI